MQEFHITKLMPNSPQSSLPSARAVVSTGLTGATLGMFIGRLCAEIAPGTFYPLYSPLSALLAALAGFFLLFGLSWWLINNLDALDWTHLSRSLWPLLTLALYLFNPQPQPAIGILVLILATGAVLSQFCDAERYGYLLGIVTGLGVFSLYLNSLMPSVLPGDSGEFQITPYVLGVPHPTGYPLWTLLGKLISYLPVGSVAYRLNLLSALAGTAAASFLWLAARALGARPVVATLAATTFAMGATMWEQSIQAEKYALNACFITLTLWLLLQWRRSAAGTRDRRWWLLTFAFFYGLSLTHHRTMMLMAPAYGMFILLTDRTVLRPRNLVRLLASFSLPLLLYLILPVLSSRRPPVNWLIPNNLERFLDIVLARNYQDIFFAYGWRAIPPQLSRVADLVHQQFTWAGLLLALIGGIWLARHDKRAGFMLLLALVCQIGFSINYPVPNNYVYYLPAYAIVALVVAAGMEALFQGFQGQTRLRPVVQLALLLLLALLPLHMFDANAAGQKGDRLYKNIETGYEFGVLALEQVAAPAYIISDWESATVLWYGQHVLKLAPETTVGVAEPLEYQWQNHVQIGQSRQQTIYLARPVVDAAVSYSLSSAGPLVRIEPQPITQSPTPAVPIEADFGEQIRLLGLDVTALDPSDTGNSPRSLSVSGVETPLVTGGETLHLTLYWQALAQPAGDYLPHLVLLDEERQVWEQASNRPVSGIYATTHWEPAEVVIDHHRLPIDPFTPTGDYSLRLRLVPPYGKIGLPVDSAQAVAPGEVELLRIRVEKPYCPALPLQIKALRAGFDQELILLGLEIPRNVTPGDQPKLMAYWRVQNERNAPLSATVTLTDNAGTAASEVTVPIKPPDCGWRAGEVIRSQHPLSIPLEASPGAWQIQMSLTTAAGEALPVRSGWAAPRRTTLTVFGLTVEPLSEIASNFDNLIRLRDFEINQDTFYPGEKLILTLEWQALKNIDQDYKVFVHVLRPNDQILTQQDHQPVNNTYPTSRWSPGEKVTDRYELQLPPESPPGTYRIAAGLYLPASLSRLPILGRAGEAVTDRVILETIEIQASP